MSAFYTPYARMHAVGKAMGRVRRRLCEHIAQLAGKPDREFVEGWDALVAAVEAGFRQEETVMDAVGYPGLGEHLAGNAFALTALHSITSRVEAGDTMLGRQALAALADILSLHRFTATLEVAFVFKPAASLHLRAHAGRAARMRVEATGACLAYTPARPERHPRNAH